MYVVDICRRQIDWKPASKCDRNFMFGQEDQVKTLDYVGIVGSGVLSKTFSYWKPIWADGLSVEAIQQQRKSN